MLYSVPYEYIKRKIDVRVTDTTIEIFCNHNQIASHHRLYCHKRKYSTVTGHMPVSHRQRFEWNGNRLLKWAEQIGYSIYQVVATFLVSKCINLQPYRSCIGLLRLADKYPLCRLEAACRKLLSFTATPSYKSIKNILKQGATRWRCRTKEQQAAILNQQRAAMRLQGALITTGGKEP